MSRPSWTAARDRQVPDDVARLLATVPEWFGRAESNAEYVDAARSKETWTVRDRDGTVVGVTLVDRHFPHVVEIHLTVVDRSQAAALRRASRRPAEYPTRCARTWSGAARTSARAGDRRDTTPRGR